MKLKSILANTFTLLGVILTMSNVFGQNPAQCNNIIGLPANIVAPNDPGVCEAVVNWAEPTYSATYSDFSGALSAVNWNYIGNGLGDTVIFNNPPNVDSITLIGANGGVNMPSETDLCLVMPFDVNLSFDWKATADDGAGGGQLNNDEPAVVIGGTEMELQMNGANMMETGSETFSVDNGVTFCFRVKSNNVFAVTTFEISNFEFEITEIVQVEGDTSGATYQVGVVDTIAYEVMDSALNSFICEFTVTVQDEEDPDITSPGNVMASQMLACMEDLLPNELEIRFSEGVPALSDNCDGNVSEADLMAIAEVVDGWMEGEVIVVNGMSISYTDNIIPHPGGVCTAPNQRKYRILRDWLLEDSAGNQDMLQQRINVVDNFIQPTIAAKGSLPDFELDALCSVEVTADSLLDRANTFDNCGINDMLDPSTYDVDTTAVIRITGSGDPFTKAITLNKNDVIFSGGCPVTIDIDMYVVDSCGNYSDTIVVAINVRDVIDPVITAMPPDADFPGCDETDITGSQLPYSATEAMIDMTMFQALNGNATDECGMMTVSYRDSIDMGLICDTKSLYGADNEGNYYRIDILSGVATVLNGSFDGVCPGPFGNFGVTAIGYDPISGIGFAQETDGCGTGFQFDALTGTITTPPAVNFGGLPYFQGISVYNGIWYTVGVNGAQLRSFDPVTQTLTSIANTGLNLSSLAIDPATGIAYAATGQGNTELYTIDLSTGTPTLINDTGIVIGSLEFHEGVLYAGGAQINAGEIYTIDIATGVPTLLGNTGLGTVTTGLISGRGSNTTLNIVRTYTVTDSCGNSATDIQNISINDEIAPSLTCPADVTVNTSDDGLGNCNTVAMDLGLVTLNDDCIDSADLVVNYILSGATIGFGKDNVSNSVLFNSGINSVSYYAKDCGGNIESCSFQVTVLDDEEPEIDCSMSPVVMANDSSLCQAVVCYDVEADDNCVDPAPTGFIPGFNYMYTDAMTGHSYYSSTIFQAELWEDANRRAEELGGYLVAINSQAEQDSIEKYTGGGRFWIGLRYSPSLGAFKWTSGEPVTFTDWAPGRPGGFLSGDYVFNLEFFGTEVGWVDAPSILPARYIVEFEPGPRVELLSGLPSGSIFPVGATQVEYRAVDAAGNADTCMITVLVEDREAPIITCVANMDIDLMPSQCDTILDFADPLVSDNCTDPIDIIINQIDGTMLMAGSAFPIGLTELIYEAVDTSDNRDTCNVLIQVNEYQAEELACENINLSLDNLDCTGKVTVAALTDGSEIGCPDSCEITITDLFGVPHPNAFDYTDIKKTFEYTISCGGNSCWATVTIEDYIKPSFLTCEDDTISCTDDISIAKEPVADDNCFANAVLVEAPYTKLDCDSLFVGKYTRKYIAVDMAGNISDDTCTQIVYVMRTQFNNIVRPPHHMGTMAFNCNEFVALPNGAPTPQEAGIPTLNGVELYPFSPALICNGFGKFEDVITFASNCKTQITRTWTFGEWHCDSIKRVSFPQFIEIVDKKGPELTVPKDFTVNVDGKNCEATVTLDPVVYVDNCNDIKDIFVTTGSGDIVNANGGVASLPVGINTIVYTVTDMCNNVSKDSMQIEVIEEQEPIAVCETFTTVALDGTGLVWLDATSIDDGSFDECDDYITLEIRRMNDPCGMNSTVWSDQVAFCCEDVDALTNPMVFLRVTDQKGNSNTCMVEVEVQDKNQPRITCPENKEVTCDFTFDPNLLDLAFDPVIVSGTPCPSSVKIIDGITSNQLDQCRIGFVYREITVEFKGEVLGVCNQTIEFKQDNPISGGLIDWPDDVTITDMCSMLDLEPENLPSNADTPDVPDGGCNLVGVTKEDKTYPFAGNGACFKILRTWSVIDWCGRNGTTSQTIPEYTWVQTIYVQNLDAPVITSSVDTIYKESLSGDCSSVPIELLASATDVCTPVDELQWDYVVTLEDGTEFTGKGNDASGTYPEGVHRVDFTVLDRCGNSNITGYVFIIETKTKPVAVCYNNLSTSLVAMDTSGTGVEVPLSMLTPEMLDNDSYHTCFEDDELQFSFDSLPGDDLLTLTCDDVGKDNKVKLYVIDPNGNFNYCNVTITVEDSLNLCMVPRVDVGGRISTYDDQNIMDTEVHLMSTEDEVHITGDQGEYMFADMPTGGEYTVLPIKDGDDMNGVSTLDLIMIQRHILGIEELTNPFALISADINNDKKITTTDLVALRKLILGVYQEFPENTSWRFVDANYDFPDEEDPWVEGFDEEYFINYLDQNMEIDFIGTKIGDVNGSAAVNFDSENPEFRSFTPMEMTLENRIVKKGDIVDITFENSEDNQLSGLQLDLSLDGMTILDVKEEILLINESVSYIVNDGIRISYEHKNREVIPSAASLFTLSVRANFDGMLRDMISINDNQFTSESYDLDLNINDLGLRWQEDVSNGYQFGVSQNQPNPWQNATSIDVKMPKKGKVNFTIFDISGKVIYQNIMNLESGINKIRLTKDMLLSSGVMFYEVEYDNEVIRKKMFNVK